MNIVVVGHVDHGKSTLIGKLLVETGSLPIGKVEQVKAHCEKTARVFEYAFLLDALKAEQSQGITIEVARIFFKTKKRNYIMIDAPGHLQLLKNMITGAARAEAALLVIDAKEGAQENSRRHAYLLSMLGIKQVVVIVNKMDLAQYNEERFQKIVREFKSFLKQIHITPEFFIPASGTQGDSIVTKSKKMPWYSGPTLVEALDHFAHQDDTLYLKPFRMPVQDVYKFTQNGDDRRIIAGTIESGTVRVGDELTFYPSGQKSKVTSIAAFSSPPLESVAAGKATGFVLADPILVKRGDLAARSKQAKPQIVTRFKTTLFWLGSKPFQGQQTYILKTGTSRTIVRLEKVERSIDASSLSVSSQNQSISKNEVAECILTLANPISIDLSSESLSTSRFVIVDQHEIAGGGTITEILSQPNTHVKTENTRTTDWAKGPITQKMKARKYGQKAGLILLVGLPPLQRKKMAIALEEYLFKTNRRFDSFYQKEDISPNFDSLKGRLESLTQAGLIVIASVSDLHYFDVKSFKSLLKPYALCIFSFGNAPTLGSNLHFENRTPAAFKLMIQYLKKKKILL